MRVLTGEHFTLSSWSSVANNLRIKYRVRLDSGRLLSGVFDQTSTADRLETRTTKEIAQEGDLEYLCVVPTSVSPKKGETFVVIGLRSQDGDIPLCQGYMEGAKVIFWNKSGQVSESSIDGRGAIKHDVTSITLVNNTLKTQDTAVPTNARWRLKSVRVKNSDNVNRTINIVIYKEAAVTNVVRRLFYGLCATLEEVTWPNSVKSTLGVGYQDQMQNWGEVDLTEGNIVRVQWLAGGASAGSVDATGLVVSYEELIEI